MDDQNQQFELLRGVPLFANCADDELTEIAGSLSAVESAAGETIVREGDPGADMYIIIAGAVAIVTEAPVITKTPAFNRLVGKCNTTMFSVKADITCG